MINIDSLTSVISALRAEERPDSITPEVLGAVLQQIADLIRGAGSDAELEEIADQIAALGVTDTELLAKINQEISDRKASIKEVVNRRAHNKFSFAAINALSVGSTETSVKSALKTANFVVLNPSKLPDDYVADSIKQPSVGDVLYNATTMMDNDFPYAIITEATSKPNNWFSFSYEYAGKRKTIKISEAYKVLSVTELVIAAELNKKVESEGYDSVVGDLEANLLTDALRKTPQVLSESEQQTARANIGAQGALRTSADLSLSSDDVLSLTDMAKKRLFIDLWNECAVDFGRYNEDTGYFELNGLTDLTWDDAKMIFALSAYSEYPYYACRGHYFKFSDKGHFRTNLPSICGGYTSHISNNISTYICDYIEVLNVMQRMPFNRPPFYTNTMFTGCQSFDCYGNPKLRKVMGIIYFNASQKAVNYGYGFPKLEEINLYNISKNYKYLYNAPKLNYTSVKCMIENRGGTNAITIWYHADVYNKILGTAADTAYEGTGGTKEEWMALADLAASKNITLATE